MIKRCFECNAPLAQSGLIVAMEQREHFAITRHTEGCNRCAQNLLEFLRKWGSSSRYWNQCVDCAFCGGKLPIVRLRFQIKDVASRHLAICEKCYNAMRDQLILDFPNFVMFVELEWKTRGMKNQARTPWPNGTYVRVRPTATRYVGEVGKIAGFRCLVQPWFGYDVVFSNGKRHFFHERDLEIVSTPGYLEKRNLEQAG